jgi:ABC-type phosphate transport system substrate-binding protein
LIFGLNISKTQELYIIINKDNPVNNVSSSDLRRFYLSTKTKWNNGKKIITTMFPAGSQENTFFIKQIIGITADEFLVYHDNEKMKGNMPSKPVCLNSELAIVRFVQKNPDAIGFVSDSCRDTNAVKVIKLDGYLPSDSKYPLREK